MQQVVGYFHHLTVVSQPDSFIHYIYIKRGSKWPALPLLFRINQRADRHVFSQFQIIKRISNRCHILIRQFFFINKSISEFPLACTGVTSDGIRFCLTASNCKISSFIIFLRNDKQTHSPPTPSHHKYYGRPIPAVLPSVF